jgi:hypothetical protein
MNVTEHPTGQWDCAHCGELIGTYEPMVTVDDGLVRKTSRTAEIRAGRLASEHYHLACYRLEHREPPAG